MLDYEGIFSWRAAIGMRVGVVTGNRSLPRWGKFLAMAGKAFLPSHAIVGLKRWSKTSQ